jgi:hypothetical protein
MMLTYIDSIDVSQELQLQLIHRNPCCFRRMSPPSFRPYCASMADMSAVHIRYKLNAGMASQNRHGSTTH